MMHQTWQVSANLPGLFCEGSGNVVELLDKLLSALARVTKNEFLCKLCVLCASAVNILKKSKGLIFVEAGMLDFEAVRAKRMTLQGLAEPLSLDDLRQLTDEMVNRMLELIAGCEDEDVVLPPIDPAANDPHAATPEEVNMPWTLGHVIVHATASAEEAAFLAAELARGVPAHGRSRYEIPWQEMTTIAGCRERLEESRRMRLASLELWPDRPHLDNQCVIIPTWPPFNPVDRFIFGLMHDDSHLGQIAEIVRQGLEARHSL